MNSLLKVVGICEDDVAVPPVMGVSTHVAGGLSSWDLRKVLIRC